MGKVTQGGLTAVDKPLLSLPARSGIDPRLKRAAAVLPFGARIGLVGHPASPRGARPSRKRKARSPQPIAACSLARRRSRAVAELAAPSARCADCVRAPVFPSLSTKRPISLLSPSRGACRPRSRNARSSRLRNTGRGLHPLSVNSTNEERVHYIDHTVQAPAMTLEHLTDQYWFPAFGLLISPEGRVCATRFSSLFGMGTCRRSRRSSSGRRRTGRTSAGCISNGSRARPVSAASIC